VVRQHQNITREQMDRKKVTGIAFEHSKLFYLGAFVIKGLL
jgi:hypothetical protein